MCEYCDKINYGIISLHHEFSLDTKGNDDGFYSLHNVFGIEVAKFKFIHCPICGRKLIE